MVLEIGIQSQVESDQRLKKMVLDAALLNTRQYKVRIKGKVSLASNKPRGLICHQRKKPNQLSKFLRRSLLIFIIKGFRTIVFIFIVISTTFRPICPPAFFRCLSNSGTFTELRTTSFIESTGFTCFDSVSHNRVQVLNIPVLLLACSEDWACNLQMIVYL